MTAEVLGYASGEAIRLDDEVVELVNGNRQGRVVEVLQPASDLAGLRPSRRRHQRLCGTTI